RRVEIMTDQLLTVDDLLRHAGWLRRLAAGLLGDGDAGQDVAQETMVAAWRRPPATDRDVRPWLATVATNTMRDLARAEARRAAPAPAVRRSSYLLALARSGGAGPAPDPGRAGPGVLVPTAVGPASGPPPRALLDCQARVRRAHDELVALEADLLEWDPDFPF